MAKVIMVCGKICSGKSTYAERLRRENNAVLLSVDEIMLAVFGQNAGEKHDEYVRNVQRYIFDKMLEILQADTNVILDCGFWTRAHRDFTKELCAQHGYPCELHYIDISDELWQERITKRNADVSAEKTSAYYVDEGLAEKFNEGFEPPTVEEIDVRVTEYDVRKISGDEVDKALALALEVFMEFEAPDYKPEGAETFKSFIRGESFKSGDCPIYAAFDGDKMIGMIGMRKNKTHINLAFVKKEYHRRGVATAIFNYLLDELRKENPSLSEITLNSSPYGLPFYLHLGFVPQSDEQEADGMRFTPMKYML